MRSTIVLKRDKIKEAFEFMKDLLHDLIVNEPEKYKFSPTDYVKSEQDHVITYDKFIALMKKVDRKMPANQVDIIFKLLDVDDNSYLGLCKNYLN